MVHSGTPAVSPGRSLTFRARLLIAIKVSARFNNLSAIGILLLSYTAISHSECDLPLFQATHSEYDINKVNIGEIDAHVNVLTESRDHGSSAAVQAANLSNSMKHNGKGSNTSDIH